MAGSCIISGEQLAAVRTKWSVFISDLINTASLVIFLYVIYSNNQGAYLPIR
jgi:hypothetical protein